MTGLLRKISSLNPISVLKDRSAFIDDIQLINRFLMVKDPQFGSIREFDKFIKRMFNGLSKQLRTQIALYGTTRQNNDIWQDLIHEPEQPFALADYVKQNFDEIFKEDLKINDNNSRFISIRLQHDYFYILIISGTKYQDQYYDLFLSIFTRLLGLFQAIQNNKVLETQLGGVQKTLIEKERALRIAEKAVKRKVYDLHNLVEASNEIYSILNFDQLINSALLTIIGQIGSESAFAMMYDNSKHAFSRNFQKGFKEKELVKLNFIGQSAIAKYLAKNPGPVYVDKITADKQLKLYLTKLKKLKIRLIAPILYTERLQGIIGIGEKLYAQDFSQTDYELFHVLVNIISISIENAQHYEEVKNLSLTDGMTNLHNYRYFSIRLKEELNRGKRNKTKVSLLILDIDHFKNYNDTLGHQAGDEALRTLGRLLKKTVRDEDVVARYGGEEFCIILPGISKDGMKPLGERIRKIVQAHSFYKERVQPNGKLTISLGGATFPDDSKTLDALIQGADEALYRAKNMGRKVLEDG
jgi:diguanylate cyclase (GGDEF)-like protein